MKGLLFCQRNIRETLRDPLSLVFCIGFPSVLLIVFQIIFRGMGEEVLAATPQFRLENLVPSMCLFGFTFLSLFTGLLVAKDRTSSFLGRLRSTGMRAGDFLLGYALAMLPVVILQEGVTFLIALCFGLQKIGGCLLSMLALAPCAILFIGIGLLIGTLLSDKSVGGVASVLVNVAVFLSGMFFPIQTMSGGFVAVMECLPFVHITSIASLVLSGTGLIDFPVWGSVLVLTGYTAAVAVSSVALFMHKLRSDRF